MVELCTLTAEQLRGKVVLVDFWTYSCINCIHTVPHVRAWAEKYKDQGLVVIGVHAPEYAFERSIGNVKQAVVADGGLPIHDTASMPQVLTLGLCDKPAGMRQSREPADLGDLHRSPVHDHDARARAWPERMHVSL